MTANLYGQPATDPAGAWEPAGEATAPWPQAPTTSAAMTPIRTTGASWRTIVPVMPDIHRPPPWVVGLPIRAKQRVQLCHSLALPPLHYLREADPAVFADGQEGRFGDPQRLDGFAGWAGI